MRSKLTEERAEEAARLVAEGQTLDAVAERLSVHRRTLLRWVAADHAPRPEEVRPAAAGAAAMPALPPAPAAGGRGVTDFGAGWPVVGPAGRRKAGWQEQALAAFDFADLRAKRHQKLRAAMDGP